MARKLLTILIPVALLAIPLASAADQDDAGSGGDAPNDGFPPMPLSVGTYQGALDVSSGDREDWYSLAFGQPSILHLTSSVASGDFLSIAVILDGNLLYRGPVQGGDVALTLPGPSPVSWVLYDDWSSNPTSYAFTVSLEPATDLQVTNLTVETGAGALPAFQPRVVGFDVANLGPASADGAAVTLVEEATQGSQTLFSGQIDLAPGATAHVSVPWSRLGAVGEVRLVARVQHRLDVVPGDDAQSVTEVVGADVDGIGVVASCDQAMGFAAGAEWTSCHALPGAGAAVREDAGGQGFGVGADASSSGASVSLNQGGYTLIADLQAGLVFHPTGGVAHVCGGDYLAPVCLDAGATPATREVDAGLCVAFVCAGLA